MSKAKRKSIKAWKKKKLEEDNDDRERLKKLAKSKANTKSTLLDYKKSLHNQKISAYAKKHKVTLSQATIALM